MITEKILITAPDGLHARPAGDFVKLVKGFADSRVTLSNGVRTVNAASMLSLLSLGLKKGTEVEIGVDGGNETEVLDALKGFLASIKD